MKRYMQYMHYNVEKRSGLCETGLDIIEQVLNNISAT